MTTIGERLKWLYTRSDPKLRDAYILDSRSAYLIATQERDEYYNLGSEDGDSYSRRRGWYPSHGPVRRTWCGVPLEAIAMLPLEVDFSAAIAEMPVFNATVGYPIIVSLRCYNEAGRVFYVDHPDCSPLWLAVPEVRK